MSRYSGLFRKKKKGNRQCCGLARLVARCPQKLLCQSPLLNWTGEKKYDKRLVSQDKDRDRSLANYHHRQNRLSLGKLF